VGDGRGTSSDWRRPCGAVGGMSDFILVLDAGTGSGRAVAVPLQRGGVAYVALEEWNYVFPDPSDDSLVEFDAEKFWGALVSAARLALRSVEGHVVAVAATSQREGIVLLDESGGEVYAGPNFDMRAPRAQEWCTGEAARGIYRITGHWPVPMFAPYRLLWLRERRPELFASIRSMLTINDWIAYRLTGECVVEASNGSDTLLQDITRRDWAQEIVGGLGLPRDILPRTVSSGTQIGTIRDGVALELGLPAGTPVYAGGADTQAALLSLGGYEAGVCGLVAGTWNPIQLVVDRPLIDPDERLWTSCHLIPGEWVLESTAGVGGAAYRWVRDVMYGHSVPYEAVTAEASSIAPTGIRLRAHLGACVMSAKSLHPTRWAGLVGGNPVIGAVTYSRGNVARAVLEGMAFAIRGNCEQLTSVSGMQLAELRACGGSTQNVLLLSIIANVLGLPVRVPQHTEGSAVGVAMSTAVSLGVFANYEAASRELVAWRDPIEPDACQVEAYSEAYYRWLMEQALLDSGL
jgi:sugar (pentulose or hexulose) kinase